jgi:hypothetical protein
MFRRTILFLSLGLKIKLRKKPASRWQQGILLLENLGIYGRLIQREILNKKFGVYFTGSKQASVEDFGEYGNAI